MLARRSTRLLAFTRRDAVRLVVAASLLVAAIAAILALGVYPDSGVGLAKLFGWLILAVLVVSLLLGWIWRFRSQLWHRNSVLVLVSLVLLVSVVLLRVTAQRSVLPYIMPTAAAALLLAVLLDAGVGLVMLALVSVLAGTVTGAVELGAYVFLGGLAGLIVIRRGERLSQYVQAGVAMALVNVAVVVSFTLLGDRDVAGLAELLVAAVAAAAGARSWPRARSRSWAACSASRPRTS